ncbi:Ubiquitin carboxyl-terminal hydrolase 2 [Rhodotorula toruloides]|uniref:ubiquitinyl hydrolase 1 n=2 Tax=Rhodotorula toruloides TaxID=5286 RepID=A0A0K3C9Q1_RHOTO|nr:Ubiquitin carboxyl-terminal hydrolase 2 [Rhodotorula toruloides]
MHVPADAPDDPAPSAHPPSSPSPPQVPPRPSFAEALSKRSPDPPPVPPKPVSLGQPAPVTTSAFFQPSTSSSSPPSYASASKRRTSSPTSTFRPAGSTMQRQRSSQGQANRPPPPSAPSSDEIEESEDELLLVGNERAAIPLGGMQTGRPKKISRMYGSSSKPSGSAARLATGSSTGWADDEWAETPAQPATSMHATSSARSTAGYGGGAEPSWQEGARFEDVVNAKHDAQHFEHAPGPSTPTAPIKAITWRESAPPPPASGAANPLDGWWTTPRVLAKPGEKGGKEGIWSQTVWDFTIDDTPTASGDYKPMGEWVDLPGSTGKSEADSQEMEVEQTEQQKPLPPVEAKDSSAAASTSSPQPIPPKPRRGFRTITREELDAARPHPSLFFCRSTFSWALLAQVQPAQKPSDAPELWQQSARTIDSQEALTTRLSPPLEPPIPLADAASIVSSADDVQREPRTLSNLSSPIFELTSSQQRVCLHSASTDFFAGAVRPELWQRLFEAREANPAAGDTALQSKFKTVETLWRIVDGCLFKGETRGLPVTGKTIGKHLPIGDEIIHDIMIATLGCKVYTAKVQEKDKLVEKTFIQLPSIDESTDEGRQHRKRLLRLWLETGIWLEDHYKRYPDHLERRPTRIRLKENTKEVLTGILGGDKLPRIPSQESWLTAGSSSRLDSSGLDPLANDYSLLGLVPDLADSVVERVYDMQCEFNSFYVPFYLNALSRIAQGRGSEALNMKVALERSQDKLTSDEINAAYQELRLSSPFDMYSTITDDDLVSAFQTRLTQVTHPGRRKALLEAARIVAAYTQSELFKTILATTDLGDVDGAAKPKMDIDAAYRTLGVDADTDDGLISMTYDIRLNDAASDTEKKKMAEALQVIATTRNRPSLLALANGQKDEGAGWQAAPAIDPDRPVGLTNIANTCYLNSLLQYFFTVRELRETILAFDDSRTPVDGRQIRVGGRLVTPAEVKRSKRFVKLLQNLYQQLIHAPVSAVTPETELAYLALVPSKEEADATTATTDAPIADKADLTDEPVAMATEDEAKIATDENSGRSPSSVLGKRKNGDDLMAEDTQMHPLSPTLATTSRRTSILTISDEAGDAQMAESSQQQTPTPTGGDEDGHRIKRGKSVDRTVASDVEPMKVDAPPPLPPRPALPAPPTEAKTGKEKEKELERQFSTYMAFGRQNDVTECMDNVMFQVEAALLANAANGQAQDAANLLRRTFYGTMRQQLVFDDPSSVSDPVRTQDQPFSCLLLDVPPTSSSSAALTRDIYDGLDAVFAPSPIELESHPAQRRVALVSPPPPVLQIQLQRVQYDRVKQTAFKSNAHLRFFEEIEVGRYCEVEEGDGEGEERRRRTEEMRKELESVRERLGELTADKGANTPSILRSTLSHAQHLSTLPSLTLPTSLTSLLTPSLTSDLTSEASDLESEISALEKRVEELRREIEGVWREGEREETRYQLTAVFIHRGTATSGHYFIYQRDHRNPQRWLKYNDAVVSEVDKEEVFRETTGDTNPYFFSYVRKDRLDAIESIMRLPA